MFEKLNTFLKTFNCKTPKNVETAVGRMFCVSYARWK